ncbi:MAG: hypothetical protein V2A34_14090, partial [Lentisphaerota bacterium]
MKRMGCGCFLLFLTSSAMGQAVFMDGLSVSNDYIRNLGLVDMASWGADVTSAVRNLGVSLGQLSGVNPSTGDPITNAQNLLPISARSLTSAGDVTTRGMLVGDGAGITNLTGTNILDGTITSLDLAADSVTHEKILNGSVGTEKLADHAVNSNKLAASAVTLEHLADRSVSSSKLLDGAVTSNKLAVDSVTAEKIARYAVTHEKLCSYHSDYLSLTNEAGAVFDGFGKAVTMIGTSRYVVAKPNIALGSGDSGVVSLYDVDGGLLASVTNPTTSVGSQFGYAMAPLPGNLLAVGAPYDDTGANDAGIVHVFDVDGALVLSLTNPLAESTAQFGKSLARLANGWLAVGAPESSMDSASAGRVYLFDADGALQRTLTNINPGEFSNFGISLASFSADILVGTKHPVYEGGIVYRLDTAGSFVASFTNPMSSSFEGFGHAMADLNGTYLAIGAPYRDEGTMAFNVGSVYIFYGWGGFRNEVRESAPGNQHFFGWSVQAMDEQRFVAGAPGAGRMCVTDIDGNELMVASNPAAPLRNRFGESLWVGDSTHVLVGSPVEEELGQAYGLNLSGEPAVRTEHIMAQAVTRSRIANGAVDESKLASGSVTGSKILDGGISDVKLAHDSVTAEKIGHGAVSETKLAGASVTADKIRQEAVIQSKLATIYSRTYRTIDHPIPVNFGGFGASAACFSNQAVIAAPLATEDRVFGFDTNGILNTFYFNPQPEDDDRFGFAMALLDATRVLISAPYA